jgi:asparagine synthase (glutamine-hydrolysing)
MCGIFGIVSKASVDPDALWFGTHRALHRGPDDWGFAGLAPVNGDPPPRRVWRSSADRGAARNYRVGLGCRRLSILDLSEAGRQPMNLPSSDLWIVFNGEIYNYLELRDELSTEHHFSTGTDTEVLLAAYKKWGVGCLGHLNGMFAFAIWDGGRMRLFMARDRFGEKPLYYFRKEDRFIFASELKQFFEDPQFNREIDRSALADFFLLSAQDHDERTFLKGIKQLRPAHWMELDFVSGELHGPIRYWMPEIADDLDRSRDRGLQESLVPILADSIRLRLRSDVPVGICLSGGLDSSTICSIAVSHKSSSLLSAYTMGFPGHPEDERSLARRLARHVGIRHTESSFDAAALWEGLDDFVNFQDGPTAGASTFASWKIFQTARAGGSTVLLNGQGCDELLAGYSKFFFFWWEILFAEQNWLRLTTSLTNYAVRNGFINWSFVNARRYFPRSFQERVKGVWQFAWPDFRRSAAPDLDIGHGNSLNRRLWKDLSEFSLPCLLHWEDRNSMAAGTEARLPFLDHRLVEAVLKTSVHTKLKAGFTKYSLRKAMRAQLPEEVCWQKMKRGFETPARRWFRTDLARPLEEMLSRKDSLLAEFFDLKTLLQRFRIARNASDNGLTEFDWFKLITTNVWLEQLRRSSRAEDAALAIQ